VGSMVEGGAPTDGGRSAECDCPCGLRGLTEEKSD